MQVASFTGEKQAISNYNASLTKAYKSAVQEGVGHLVWVLVRLCLWYSLVTLWLYGLAE